MELAILITTKNRISDLVLTLNKINYLLNDEQIECVVFDDGSTDGTYDYVKENFPNIRLERNNTSKGYIFCRNRMLNETQSEFAISLDDDAHFITLNPLRLIPHYFNENPNCGVIAFRIFWGLQAPNVIESNEKKTRVKGFVGCGHVWRMNTWREIPNYPEWFVFYGEEEFAAYQLFKNGWEVHYLPNLLVHHRVDVKSRMKNADYTNRLRRSLCSGWYLYFLFYPISKIPKKLFYSLWIQLKNKVLKGDIKALKAIVLAMKDLWFSIPKIIKSSNRLSNEEFERFQEIEDTRIYWKPKNK